jgi:hypothetical protein
LAGLPEDLGLRGYRFTPPYRSAKLYVSKESGCRFLWGNISPAIDFALDYRAAEQFLSRLSAGADAFRPQFEIRAVSLEIEAILS